MRGVDRILTIGLFGTKAVCLVSSVVLTSRHRQVGLSNIYHSLSGGHKSQIKVLTDLVSGSSCFLVCG